MKLSERVSTIQIQQPNTSFKEKLSPSSRKILKDWLWADYMLYDYFKKELENKKKEMGAQNIKSAVVKLQDLNAKIKDECVLDVVKNTNTLSSDFVPWSKDVLGFKIDESKESCKYFGISENHFIEHLRDLQMYRLQKWRSGLNL